MNKSNKPSNASDRLAKVDREECAMLQKAIDEALRPVAERFGVSMSKSRATYYGNGAKFSVEAAVVDDSGQAMTRERAELLDWLDAYGVSESDVIWEAKVSRHGLCRLVGRSSRARKYPILVEVVETGAKYKFSKTVLRCFIPEDRRSDILHVHLSGGNL